jgi:hypothetical protein
MFDQETPKKRGRKPQPPRTACCDACGVSFQPIRGANGTFCSKPCMDQHRRDKRPDWMGCSVCLSKIGIGMAVQARLLRTSKSRLSKLWAKDGIKPDLPECGEWRRYAQRKKSNVCGWWGNSETAALWMRQHQESFVSWSMHPIAKARTSTISMMKRYNTDMDFRIRHNLRTDMRARVRRNDGRKAAKTESLLGCSIKEFRRHLESSFSKSMNWENYGKHWEIDHIIPASWFDLRKEEHQRRCWHHSNLRPLTKKKNRGRGNRADPQILMTHLCDFANH